MKAKSGDMSFGEDLVLEKFLGKWSKIDPATGIIHV